MEYVVVTIIQDIRWGIVEDVVEVVVLEDWWAGQ